MKKAVLIASILAFSFYGCGGKHALRKEMVAQQVQLRIVTECVPGQFIRVRHSGGNIAATVLRHSQSLIGVFVEPFAKMSAEDWQAAVEKDISASGVPRFFELVMSKVVEKISREFPNWRPVVVDDQGVDPGSVKSLLRDSEWLLVLYTGFSCAPGLSTAHGLESRYLARLYIGGDLVWEKSLKYQSDNEKGRYQKIEDFSANNWQRLKEEFEHAARTIAGRLVDDLVEKIRKAE